MAAEQPTVYVVCLRDGTRGWYRWQVKAGVGLEDGNVGVARHGIIRGGGSATDRVSLHSVDDARAALRVAFPWASRTSHTRQPSSAVTA